MPEMSSKDPKIHLKPVRKMKILVIPWIVLGSKMERKRKILVIPWVVLGLKMERKMKVLVIPWVVLGLKTATMHLSMQDGSLQHKSYELASCQKKALYGIRPYKNPSIRGIIT